MNRIILLLLLVLPYTAFSQHFIGKSKSQVKKDLQKKVAKNDTLDIVLHDNDSTLVFSYLAGKVQPVDFIYSFNKAGKCYAEKVKANCDSCFRKYLQNLLAQEKFEWKKINENQYISRYSDRMMIELPGNSNEYSYSILHTDWTKELYDMLKGN